MPSLRRLTGWLAALAATGVVVALLLRAGHAADEIPSTTPATSSGGGISGILEAGKRQAPRLTAEHAKAYALGRQADALCLIALARATGDPSWLQRALAEHPDDPRVQMERWNTFISRDERRAAAQALQQAAPDNSLGAYLVASGALEEHDLRLAARMMVDASFASGLQIYDDDIVFETQAAFIASGMDARAAWDAAKQAELETNEDRNLALDGLARDMFALQHDFIDLGYWDEADFVFERNLALGEELQYSATARESALGIGIQRYLLTEFDPQTIVSDDGTRAGQRLAELEAAQDEIDVIYEAMHDAKPLDAAEQEQYQAIYRRDGELAALRWLVGRK